MLRLLKKYKKLSVILFAVVLCSCGSVPKRPHGEVCAISSTPVACACVDSDSGDPTRVIPINQCTGYIAIDANYYNQLEDWIQEIVSKVRGFPKAKSALKAQMDDFKAKTVSARAFVGSLQ